VNVTVAIFEAPYGREKAYTALRFALTSAVDGHKVNIFLFQDGIYVARKGQAPAEFPNYAGYLQEAMKEGVKVKVCSVCAKARGVGAEDFIEGIEMADMHDYVRWVSESDKVLHF
jgi:tRNA 2-thiouridine synthesizing protein D